MHVDRWGAMGWLCWPRFDSPPPLRRLIDPNAGGSWRLSPACAFASSRRYLPDSNVLQHAYTCAEGTTVASEFMSVPADDAAGSQVVRIIAGRAQSRSG